MSDTPRVDAVEYEDDTGGMVVDSRDARQLERYLAAANAKLAAKPDVAGLVKECQAVSVLASDAHKIFANAKSARNIAAGDEGAYYAWCTPEQTLEGRCASALLSLSAQLSKQEESTDRFKGERDAARAECAMLRERIPDEGDTKNLKEANVKLRFEINDAMSALKAAQKGYVDQAKVCERLSAQLTQANDERASYFNVAQQYQEEAGELRAQLAKKEAECEALREMLREVLDDGWIRVGYGASHEDVSAVRELEIRIRAAIAARKP